MGKDVLAYDYPVLGAFWTAMWVFLWVLWIFLLFRVIADIVRDDAMGGWHKAAWMVFVIVLPFLGVFLYVVARGRGMGERERQHTKAQREAVDQYIRETAGDGDRGRAVDDLSRLSELRAKGDISEEEFRRAKEAILR